MPPEPGPSRFLRGVLHLLDDLVTTSQATTGYRFVGVHQAGKLILTFVGQDGQFDIWLRPVDDTTPAYRRCNRLLVGHLDRVPNPEARMLLDAVCQRVAARESTLAGAWVEAILKPAKRPEQGRDDNHAPEPSPPVPPVRQGRGVPRLLVPLAEAREVQQLARAGADMFYCGILLDDLRAGTPEWAFENGRPNPIASIARTDLPRTVAQVHDAGRPLLLAMNRQYADEAMPAVTRAVADAIDAGIDGLILADLHLAAFVRKHWPDMHLTGSALMGLPNPGALELAQAIGLNRVVLPRATRLPEIARMAQGPGPELEVFVARERCRFANAFCQSEHLVPPRSCNGHDRLQWGDAAICHQEFVRQGENFRLDNPADSMEACGLCALPFLRRFPRIGVFKIVGRGWCASHLQPFVEAARRILDLDIETAEDTRTLVQEDARLRCSPATCYFPQTPVAPVRGHARPRGRRIPWNTARPTWAPSSASLYGFAGPEDAPAPPPEAFEGIAVGHETCAHLLPSPGRLRQWLDATAGCHLILVLPPLYGPDQQRQGLALADLIASQQDALVEITVNDLGTLHALRESVGPRVVLSLGRLLVWMHNDPRLMRLPSVLTADSLITATPMAHLETVARMFGIRRATLSVPNGWPTWRSTVVDRLTVDAGPALLSTGRACSVLAERAGRTMGGHPFIVPEHCDRPCLGARSDAHIVKESERFILDGNALYAPTTPLGPVPDAVDRVILRRGSA